MRIYGTFMDFGTGYQGKGYAGPESSLLKIFKVCKFSGSYSRRKTGSLGGEGIKTEGVS